MVRTFLHFLDAVILAAAVEEQEEPWFHAAWLLCWRSIQASKPGGALGRRHSARYQATRKDSIAVMPSQYNALQHYPVIAGTKVLGVKQVRFVSGLFLTNCTHIYPPSSQVWMIHPPISANISARPYRQAFCRRDEHHRYVLGISMGNPY